MLILLLAACAPGVIEQYARVREDALSIATGRPADWSADAEIHISGDALNRAVGAAVKAAVGGDMAPVKIDLPLGQSAALTPRLVVDRVSVGPTDVCSPCLDFSGSLLGKAAWDVQFLQGSFPFEVAAAGTLAIEVNNGREITARLKSLRSIRVRVLEIGRFQVNPSSTLEQWLGERLLRGLPPVQLTTLDTASLPFRDLRMSTATDGLSIELLTNVPESSALPPMSAPTADIEIAVSEKAIVGLARRAAFNAGPQDHEIVADPRELMVNGDQFTLLLRLWRLSGKGWWRDYTVTGRLEVANGQLELKPEKVTEAGKSPGAGLIDPLAALFEGMILRTVRDAMMQSLPAHTSQSVGEVELGATVTGVEGRDGALIVRANVATEGG